MAVSKLREGARGPVDADLEERVMLKKAWTKLPELEYSMVKFEDVGGNEETLMDLCKLLIQMRHPEVHQKLGIVPPRGFLLHGPPGCGKSLLAQAVAGEMEFPILKVSAPELVSGISGESEQKLLELFEQALCSAPCILFIDEIDAIAPKREVASSDMERRIVAQLLTCMDDLNSLCISKQVLVIGATNRSDSLDPALRRAGRFDREIFLGIPDEAARFKILKTISRKLKLAAGVNVERLAKLTPGFVGADLMALCREATMAAVHRKLNTDEDQRALEPLLFLLRNSKSLCGEQLSKLCIVVDDFMEALSRVQPSTKREGFTTIPEETWADVGALEDTRKELTKVILAPVRSSPELLGAMGLSAPKGVLLAGPPGCGKTLLAKAVANEAGLNFIYVKGPELLKMNVGESERAVREVFQRGRNSAPCLLFFNEFDGLCPQRSGHRSEACVRVVDQLLTEMDALQIDCRLRRQVFIMAASNRPDLIDRAALRPGRLEKKLYVGLPEEKERFAILKAITKGGTKPRLTADVKLEEIASDIRCSGFTGADLSVLVREASFNAISSHAHLSAHARTGHTSSSRFVKAIRVSKPNFQDAFNQVRPSVSKKDQGKYEKLKKSLAEKTWE